MRQLLRIVIWRLVRVILSLRYRVTVKGLEKIRGLRGALVLPSHPGYVDPPLAYSVIAGQLAPRPVMADLNLDNILVSWIPRLTRALMVPDMERPSAESQKQIQQVIETVISDLNAGGNIILWPAGRVWRRGQEAIGSARGPVEILRAAPNAKVVLMRTSGLWGSSFTRAYTGQSPPLARRIVAGLFLPLASLFFFMPRRHITITIEVLDRSQLPELTRDKLNRFLESWYNEPGPEEPRYVPYHWLFGARRRDYPPPPAADLAFDLSKVKSATQDAVRQMLAEKLGRELRAENCAAEMKLEALGLDSLESMDVTMAIEQRFNVSCQRVPLLVGDLWALAEGLAESAPPVPAPPQWFRPPAVNDRMRILGPTIPQAFVERALRCRKDIVAADDRAGAVTYERLLVGALILARQFKTIAGANIGVILPASVAADMTVLALSLAGKVPVVLNWTTGPAYLAHSAKLCSLTHVISARSFLDRVDIKVEGAQFVHLEEITAKISKLAKLGALLKVRFMPGSVRRMVADAKPDAIGAILFTSGSEKAPKAVPLTHANILANISSVADSFPLSTQDSLLSFLPPFHSFGLTFASLAPILAGCKIVHHPDPTAGSALARKVAAYGVTVTCGTPSFIANLVSRGTPDMLKTLRLIVTGAEKCPDALFALAKEKMPQCPLLEGYGVTECSPLVTCNRPGLVKAGTVGTAIPNVELMLVDPDTRIPLPARPTIGLARTPLPRLARTPLPLREGQGEGRASSQAIAANQPEDPTLPQPLPAREGSTDVANPRGMLIVAGPNVFNGYLGDTPTPFVEHGGRQWYATGDLVEIDEAGFVHFRGRLKRFLKAGGEMISLPALEEPFVVRFAPTDDGPRVAVEGIEAGDAATGGGAASRRIVLFTTEDLTLAQANAMLAEAGFRGVMRLDEVRKLDRIPILGIGKVDYKLLRTWVASGAGQNT